MINKRLINTGEAIAPFDSLQNFETVTYTGNGGTQKITGYIRKGAAFNGSSSYIQTSLSPSLATISHSLWFYADSADSTNALYYFDNRGGRIDVNITGTGSNSVSNSLETVNITATTATSQWNHLLLVYTGWASSYSGGSYGSAITVTAYLNGSSIGTASPTPYGQTIGMRIGRSGGGYYFEGRVDQFRVFNSDVSSNISTLTGETYASSTKSTKDIFNDGSAVALYELDEDANDTGRGTIDSGQSAVFNGSSSNIDIGGNIVNGLTELSVSLWVFWDGTNSVNDNYFIALGKSNSGKIFSADITNNSGIIGFYDGATVFNSNSAVPQNTWTHIVITANATVAKIYLNGNLDSTHTISSLNFDSSGNVGFIGSWISGTDYEFDGKIDQVRVYSSALSASDVEALVSETSVPTANLLAHYKLDGDVTDETGTYNGTATSITYSDPAEFPVYNGTPTAVNFLGMAFQPDLVISKSRSFFEKWNVFDSVREATKRMYLNGTHTEATQLDSLTSFDSNGYSIGAWTDINTNNATFVSYSFKGGGASVLNQQGNIDSQVSANPAAGFSIVKFTSPSSGVATIGTGLNTKAELIISKVTNTVADWPVFVDGFDTTDYILLNTTGAKVNHSSDLWNLSNWSNTTFGCHRDMYGTSNTVIAYCFHSVDGYQKVGSYTGTGSSGNAITGVGFEPRFLMIKATNANEDWVILDAARNTSDPRNTYIMVNSSNAEFSNTSFNVNFDTDGFTINGTAVHINGNGTNYIYLAIA